MSYYSDLYRTLQTYTENSLHAYLGEVELPTFSDSARQQLDALLALEELQVATGMFPNSKAPWEDGVPVEVYKQHDKTLLPKLLEVFNEAKKMGASHHLWLKPLKSYS